MVATNPFDPIEQQRRAEIMEIVSYDKYWIVHDGRGKLFRLRFDGQGTVN